MDKLPVILPLGIALLQGLVLALAGLNRKLANLIDDNSGISYTHDLSRTVEMSYEAGFYAASGAISAIIYLILLISKVANMNINKSIAFFAALVGSLLQFGLATYIAVLVSKSINPHGKYAVAFPYTDSYHQSYDLSLATTVIYWVITVPCSAILVYLGAKNIGGEGSQKVEANSTTVINN